MLLLKLYACSKYPSDDVEKMRPGPLIAAARRLDASMMDGGDEGVAGQRQLRRVYPFTMSPGTALQRATEWIV